MAATALAGAEFRLKVFLKHIQVSEGPSALCQIHFPVQVRAWAGWTATLTEKNQTANAMMLLQCIKSPYCYNIPQTRIALTFLRVDQKSSILFVDCIR
jgi:hypothetical protein